MFKNENKNYQKIISISLVTAHLIIHIISGIIGWINPFELFNLILLIANIIIVYLVFIEKGDFLIITSVMLIIASHALIGQKIAPDSLTSGSILMINILILYVGFKIFQELTLKYVIVFITSYIILFFIFIMKMENAEPLFLLSLLGLAATARNFKLLSYFWVLVFSFTLFQPYSWQSALILFFLLKVVFSIKSYISKPTVIIFLLCGFVLLVFVFLPILVIVLEEDPRNIINIIKNIEIRKSIFLTGITATFSTIILVIFCVPLSYALSRARFYGKTFFLSLIDIPIIIPQSAAGIALLRVFGKNQFIGEFFYNTLGLRFDGSVVGICLAQIFVALPFIIKSSITGFDSVSSDLEKNAQILGSSSIGAFFKVALPISARAIFVGAVLSWARAAGEFGAVLFIAPQPETAPITVYNRFTSVGLIQTAPLVATIILFSVLMFFLMQFTIHFLPQISKKELY